MIHFLPSTHVSDTPTGIIEELLRPNDGLNMATAQLNGSLYAIYPNTFIIDHKNAIVGEVNTPVVNEKYPVTCYVMSLYRFTLKDNPENQYSIIQYSLLLCNRKSTPFTTLNPHTPVLLAFKGRLVLLWVSESSTEFESGIYASIYCPDSNTTSWSQQYRVRVLPYNIQEEAVTNSGKIRESRKDQFNSGSPIMPFKGTSPQATVHNDKIVLTWVGADDGSIYYAELFNEGLSHSSQEDTDYGIYGGSMVFKKAIKIERRGEFGILNTTSPAIVSLDSKQLMLVWFGAGNDGLYYSRFDGQSWMRQKHIDGFDIENGTNPSIHRIDDKVILAAKGECVHTVHTSENGEKRYSFLVSVYDSIDDQFEFREVMQNAHPKCTPTIGNLGKYAILLWSEPHSRIKSSDSYKAIGLIERKVKAGVLMIGSLYWQIHSTNSNVDEKRQNWRENWLNMDKRKSVKVQIRYGRYSHAGCYDMNDQYHEKNELYTMVFSSNRSVKKDPYDSHFSPGQGYLVPYRQAISTCKDQPITLDDLDSKEELRKNMLTVSKSLAEAEGIYSDANHFLVTSWGAISIIVNPDSVKKDMIREVWEEIFTDNVTQWLHVKKRKSNTVKEFVDRFCMDGEESCIGMNGVLDASCFLSINSVNEFLGLDFIITSVTRPQRVPINAHEGDKPITDRYPTSKEVAELAAHDHRQYFQFNNGHSILTFEDNKIITEMQSISKVI